MIDPKIPDRILDFQEQKRMLFESNRNQIPPRLRDYLRSREAYSYWGIIILAIITALIVLILPENDSPLVYAKYILGLIFVLWLPGHTFVKLLFPKKELDSTELFALSMGMSMVLVSIIGFLLNYTPWGIRPASITISLLALTCTFATAAVTREHQDRTQEKTQP